MATTDTLSDILDLASLESAHWEDMLALLAASGVPLNAGDPDPDPDPEPDPDPDPDPEPDPDPASVDWKSQSRKHERRAKKVSTELDEALAKLREFEDGTKSDHEKAVADARAEAKAEVEAAAAAERRADRLDVAVTRIAARGVKVDDKDTTVKFADPDDALLHLERAIQKGDVDEDDIFGDDNRVNSDAVQAALTDLLKSKPHLAAANDGGAPRVPGSSDAGRGGSGKSADDESVDEILARKRRHAGK